MKTKIFSALGMISLFLQLSAFTPPAVEVNEKLIKSFQTAFPEASQVSWREAGDHYFVHFTLASVISEIEYDQDGDFQHAYRYHKNPDLLPLNITWNLHRQFPDKTIFAITESSVQSETTYYIKKENQKSFITVKATGDGDLTVMEKVIKQRD